VLLILGVLFLIGNSAIVSMFKAFPRSKFAAGSLFPAGAGWFLYAISHLSEADFGEYRKILFVVFALVAVLSFFYVPDFLAVRGACILMLMAAMVLLDAGYMVNDLPLIWVYKAVVYLGVAIALYLGAAPYRLRDFFQWLFVRPNRPRILGGGMTVVGVLLAIIAFNY
jgi:hypothetical protein